MNNSTNPRILFVSHRSPHIFHDQDSYLKLQLDMGGVGGVAATIGTALQMLGGLWVSGSSGNQQALQRRIVASSDSAHYELKFIELSSQDITDYYYGFANCALWPLCHSFPDRCFFYPSQWQAYKRVNLKFADSILEELSLGDVVWIHDYHFGLVPQLIRQRRPHVCIFYFWHIPFPDIETFSLLPWSRSLLGGLLHTSMLCFHIESYTENFFHCVEEMLAASVDRENGIVHFQGNTTIVRTIPLGINYEYWQELANSPIIHSKAQAIRAEIDVEFLGLAVDRLDYTKGVLERVRAVELFLQENPNYRGRFTLLQIATPSRLGIDQYREYRTQVEREIYRVNNRWRDEKWCPIKYKYETLPRWELTAYYQAADLACILPLRDGMNLVAKEYVASCVAQNGVLLLSNTAGVAEEFNRDALLVNPFDIKEVAKAIKNGLELRPIVRVSKIARLRTKVESHTLTWWLQRHLEEFKALTPEYNLGSFVASMMNTVSQDFTRTKILQSE